MESVIFFRAVYHSKNHVIPHPVNAVTLDVILNIFQCWKTNNNMQVKLSKYNGCWKLICCSEHNY